MTKLLVIPVILLACVHLAWHSPESTPHGSTRSSLGCENCYTDDVEVADLPSGLTFEGSNDSQRRPGDCQTTTSGCKGTSGCKYWGTFKLENPGSDDRWIETPGGARVKAPAGSEAELYFSEDEGFEVPCRGDDDPNHEVHGATREFKIFEKKKGGESLGKVAYECSQCQ